MVSAMNVVLAMDVVFGDGDYCGGVKFDEAYACGGLNGGLADSEQ